MNNLLLHCIAFACLGITTEIFFTAFYNLFFQIKNQQKIDFSLIGHTYVWMVFIYGLTPILFYLNHSWLFELPFAIRLFIYPTAIYIIEFTSGWILEKLTGRCPWHYEEGWAIKGYIRLDYFLFWLIFGIIIEAIYLFLNEILPLFG